MVFILKKVVSQFLMPLPLMSVIFLAGCALVCFSKHKRIGKGLQLLSLALFLLASYGIGGGRYLFQLEREYPSVELEAGDADRLRGAAIVVLGQGLSAKTDLPLRYQTTPSFQLRLQEGVRLFRKIPDAVLLISLAGEAERKRKEQFVDEYALEHGLNRASMRLIANALDTSDEAKETLKLLHTNQLVIVTSASHLRRAVKIFRKELARRQLNGVISSVKSFPCVSAGNSGVCAVLPAPCDYQEVTVAAHRQLRWFPPLPSPSGLLRTHQAMHELLGNLYEDLTD